MKLKKSLASLLSTAVVIPSAFGSCFAAPESESAKAIPKSNSYESNQSSGENSLITDFTFNGRKIQSGTDVGKMKLDLFEGDNLNTALMRGLEFILSDTPSPYIDDKSLMVKGIKENSLIKESLQSTVDYIKTKKENDNDKNLELLKRLHTIEAMIKSDKNISRENPALHFISAMKCAYQMIISRSVAKNILEDNREKIESRMGSETYSAGSELSSTIPQEGFNAGICAGVSTDQQSTETTFYKIDNSGNLGVSIGTGFKDYLSANASCALGITNSLVFYSLEEFLDSGMDKGNISFLKLKDENLKKVISSRKKMQNDEDAIIVKLKTSIEPFLKSTAIIPQNLALKIPEPTYTGISEKNKKLSANYKLAAEAGCMAKAGMNVSAETSLSKIKSYHPYLDLIDENFLVTDYCADVNDLTEFLKTSGASKYKEIKEILRSDKQNADKSGMLSIIISNLTSDLKRYNTALAIMADDTPHSKSKSEARTVKKNIEKNWIGTKGSLKNKHSRETMLKIAISLGAYLRTLSSSDEEKRLLSSLYDEVQNLSLLQKFTNKLFFKTQQGFGTSRTSSKVTVNGETYLDIPFVGKTNFTLGYSDTDSPLYSEKSKDITVTTQLPMINGKLYGSEILKDKLKDFIKKISETNNAASLTLSDSLNLVDKEFDNVASSYGVEKTLTVPTVISMKNYMNLHFYLTKIPKTEQPNELIPLPDNNLIEKTEDSVILKLTKRIDSLNTDVKINPEAASIKASQKIGKTSSKVGPDSLIFITNKFNTCELSKNLTASAEIWKRFKKAQKDSLEKLFINITDNASNAKYELQNVYSMIIGNIQNKSGMSDTEKSAMTTATENIFRNFLDSCGKLKLAENNESEEEYYETSSKLLDAILKLNYDFVWYPALVASNSK